MRDGEVVDGSVKVQAGVALARVEAACEGEGEFADEAVVGDAEVAELEGEADEVGDEVGGVDAAVDEDGAIDVRMVCWRIDGRLEESEIIILGLRIGGTYLHRHNLIINATDECDPDSIVQSVFESRFEAFTMITFGVSKVPELGC